MTCTALEKQKRIKTTLIFLTHKNTMMTHFSETCTKGIKVLTRQNFQAGCANLPLSACTTEPAIT